MRGKKEKREERERERTNKQRATANAMMMTGRRRTCSPTLCSFDGAAEEKGREKEEK